MSDDQLLQFVGYSLAVMAFLTLPGWLIIGMMAEYNPVIEARWGRILGYLWTLWFGLLVAAVLVHIRWVAP